MTRISRAGRQSGDRPTAKAYRGLSYDELLRIWNRVELERLAEQSLVNFHTSPSYTQQGQRAYLDSAAAVDSLTGAAAENANYTLDVSGGDQILIIRTEIEETNGAGGNQAGDLEFSVNSTTVYNAVTTTSTEVQNANGSQSCTSTDGDTIGNLLTTSTATFQSGVGVYDDGGATGNMAMVASTHVEVAHAIKFIAANLNNGDIIRFRVAGIAAWSNIIQITISKINNYTITADAGAYTIGGLDWALQFDGSTTYAQASDAPFDFAGTAAMTVEFWMNLDTTQPNTFARLVSKSNGTDGWNIYFHNTDLRVYMERFSGATNDNASQAYTKGTTAHVACVYDGSDIQVFVNGVGGTKTASSRSLLGTTLLVTFGDTASGPPAAGVAGVMDDIRIWSVARTEGEIRANMNKTLTGSESGLAGYWKFSEGTGSTAADSVSTNDATITAAAWTSGLVNTGLTWNPLIVAAAGTYTLAGQDVTLTHSGGSTYTLTADAGAYSLAGVDANLEYHSVVVAASGAYSYGGQIAGLLYDSLLTADPGSYALAGMDANLELHSLIGVDSGAYVYAGTDANLTHQSIMVADAGAYALAGQDAGLVLSTIMAADAGSYAYSGVDANLELHAALAAAAGAYALSGTDANLEFNRLFAVDGGTYVLTGQDAGLNVAVVIGAETGAYILTGQAAGLTFDSVVGALAGSYALTGADAGLLRSNIIITSTSGAYVYTGAAAGLTHVSAAILHRAELIMDAVVAAVTGLTTTGSNVYRARAYPIEVDDLPAIVVIQGADTIGFELLSDLRVSKLRVNLDAIAREPTAQLGATLNKIREEITVALMADYKLGLDYVDGCFEQGAEEPVLDSGDAPTGRLRSVWEVTYERARTDPST